MKKIIALFLSLVMTFTLVTPACAVDSSDKNDLDVGVAATLAMLFVGSNLDDVDTWTMETRISSVDTLYGNHGEQTAYCINLETNSQSTGYIVISANASDSLVQEYGVDCQPIYKSNQFREQIQIDLDGSNKHKIYYAGPMQYSDKPILKSAPEKPQKSDINNEGKNLREKNLILLNEIRETGTLTQEYFVPETETMPLADRISDPLVYLKKLYPSWSFVNAGYYNMGESAIAPYYISETNACAMYAISAILKYHLGSAYSFNSIKNTVLQLFRNSSYSSGNATGNYYLDIGEYKGFTNLCLSHYGLDQTASSSMRSWSTGKSSISRNRPVMLNIWYAPGGNYSDHTVTAYAWTQFVTVSNNITYQFFKVRDGYTTSNVGRYVCFNSMKPSYVTTV